MPRTSSRRKPQAKPYAKTDPGSSKESSSSLDDIKNEEISSNTAMVKVRMLSVTEVQNMVHNVYSDVVRQQLSNKLTPDKLDAFMKLNEWKDVELPQLIAQRYAQDHHTYITKDELVRLMEWKLSKGKFRPRLRQLIASNPDDTVQEVTSTALTSLYQLLEDTKHPADIRNYIDKYLVCLKEITLLKGVGPATGSLICSLIPSKAGPTPPFFSDEVAAELLTSQKPKYNLQELKEITVELLKKWNELQMPDISPSDLEKVVYCLHFGDRQTTS